MLSEEDILQLKNCVSDVVELSDECWLDFLRMISIKKLEATQYFSKEFSLTKELAFIQSGLVRIYSVDEEGIEWNQSLLRENEFIMASLNPTLPSPVSIQAIFETKLLTIRYNDFMKLTILYPELSKLIQLLSTKYLEREKNKNHLLMIKKSSDRLEHFRNEFSDVYHKIPKEHIARYIGIAEEDLKLSE